MKHNVWKLILSCEHGGNRVPPDLRRHFKGASRALKSHRGVDIGALSVAKILRQRLHARLLANEISRLVVDCNRSEQNPKAFSEWSGPLDRYRLLSRFHRPYWRKFRALARAKILHLSVHSFTPVFDGYVRKTDIGILFDPHRKTEREFATRFKSELQLEFPLLTIHLNRPYRGSGDGLTTSMRNEKSPNKYLGIEIELNQKLLRGANTRAIAEGVARALINSKWI